MAIRSIKVDGKKLDEAIKKVEGSKFNQSKVSCYIMNMKKSYYGYVVTHDLINLEVLERVCQYYDFDKEDFMLTEEDEKKQIQQKADTMNYDNLILLLSGIDKTLKELLAAEKSTQFILNEMKNNLMKSNSNEKQIIETLESVVKSNDAKRNAYSKFRSVQ